MRARIERRRWLAWLAALCALPLVPLRRAQAQAQSEAQTAALEAMIRKVTGGAPVQRGRVQLDIPTLADNGNSVSLKVGIDGGRVRSIHLFAPRNPRPNLANFHFGAGAGRVQVSTRIRLSGSQTVLAIAALEDGSFWSASAEVAVTVSACWDAS